ncbi:hypothetical protein [Flavobacterium sp. LS1P3]|uniref:hypothetical protein n=1 Tax=Flavobacterium sp. LS1P3 TaxID=3401720 RepID=UPI003AB0E6CD
MNKIILSFTLFSMTMRAQQYNSNFKIEKLMESDVSSMGQKILYPQVKDAAVTMMKITFPPRGDNCLA